MGGLLHRHNDGARPEEPADRRQIITHHWQRLSRHENPLKTQSRRKGAAQIQWLILATIPACGKRFFQSEKKCRDISVYRRIPSFPPAFFPL
jgi:hypothetical protein